VGDNGKVFAEDITDGVVRTLNERIKLF